MIRKNNKNLLTWIHENIIDFESESDNSCLTWESTHEEALKFLHSIPRKERVQKYGFYSTNAHFFLVENFDDIKEGLIKGFISEQTCKVIYNWNCDIEREHWDMADVNEVLNPDFGRYPDKHQKFVSNTIQQLKQFGLIECVNPEAKSGKLFRLTKKGEEIFGDI